MRDRENSKVREKAGDGKLPLQGIIQIIAIFNRTSHFPGQIRSAMFAK